MQRLFLLTSSCFFLLMLVIACSSNSSESAFPKQLPVDERAKKQQQEALAYKKEAAFKEWAAHRQTIEALLETSGYYTTKDGNSIAVKEYTTYYLEEDKTTPIKTRYTYNTGSFDILYWLPEKQVWLERDGYDFLIQNNQIVRTMRSDEEAEATSIERKEALKIVARAREEMAPIAYTL
ncbi:MAG: hypothetical protein AB8E82_08620 [Aureispira sp.]